MKPLACQGHTSYLEWAFFLSVHGSVLLPSAKSRLPMSLYFLKAQGHFCSTGRNLSKVTVAQCFHSPHRVCSLGSSAGTLHFLYHHQDFQDFLLMRLFTSSSLYYLKGTHDHIVNSCNDPAGPLGSSPSL